MVLRRGVGLECRPIASVLIGDIGLSEWPKGDHITRWRDWTMSENSHSHAWKCRSPNGVGPIDEDGTRRSK